MIESERSEHTVVLSLRFLYICNSYTIGCVGLSLITVPIHEGEARVRWQLEYDNPNVAMV